MLKQIRTIAFYTLLEALRNRLIWLVLIIALIAVGLSGFLNEMALTESKQIQVALLAAFLRFAAVFLLATFVVTSMARELNDKGLELLLALPLPRPAYLFGKFAGFGLLAVLPAVLFGGLTLFFTQPAQSLLWMASLVCESWIVVAFSMLCVLSFHQVMGALSATMGFYLLARSVVALQLIASDPLSTQSVSQKLISFVVNSLSVVLPHLDTFTRTEWLVYQTGNLAALGSIALQSGLCLALLGGVALFDLYRKNI